MSSSPGPCSRPDRGCRSGPAPSGSVQHRSDRDARTRSWTAPQDSSTHAAAFTRARTRRASPRRHRAPPRRQLVLGTGISGGGIGDGRHLRTGQHPERHAASVVGSASTRSGVSNVARRTEGGAGRRRQPRRHITVHAVVLPRAGRTTCRVASAFPAAPRRSISSNSSTSLHTPAPSNRSGSRPASSLRSCSTAHRDRRTWHSPAGDPSTGEVEEAAPTLDEHTFGVQDPRAVDDDSPSMPFLVAPELVEPVTRSLLDAIDVDGGPTDEQLAVLRAFVTYLWTRPTSTSPR